MIATPTKSESINYSISNNKIDLELSDNKIKTDHSLQKLPQSKEKLIKDDNLTDSDTNIYPIHNSIISDNLEELEKLLKLGLNPDIVNKSGETPLYLSVDIENYDAMVILLEFGADCNIQKDDGYTPLHLAAEKKLDIYVCSLLSHGANPNIINKTNLQSALHIAIINKFDEYTLSKFKENHGDIYNIKDKFDKSPFDYAINDEKYKNLLISIFNKNKSNNKNNESLNGANNSNSNLDYYNFVSLSRNIHITNEDNNDINNNENDDNQNKDTENCNNNIGEINNCLKKQLIFNSNSKDKDIASSGLKEQKSNKLIFSAASNSSGLTQNNNNKSSKNNIINLVSDKGSNFSNNTYNFSNHINDNDIENQNINAVNQNENMNNLIEQETKLIKSNNSTSYKKINVISSRDTNLNFVLSSMNSDIENHPTSHSLNLYNKILSIRANFSKYIKIKNNSNQTFNSHIDNSLSHTNTNIHINNTNGNISINSYNNKKKDEGISELNPLDMINQMASSSNNSNIFSELQINSNTKKDGENSSKIQQTEEEFYNEENGNNENGHSKLILNEELNAMKENISGNFCLNNNEPSNNKEINYINSLDDSLEYSKSKSFITSALNSKDKNENNKDESFNIYNNNDNHNRNNNNKSIERYKNTTSNNSKSRSKLDYDMDSEHSNEKICSISNSNISNIFNNNKQNNTYHYRQLSYHNNRQSSSNKNKSYNSSTNNSNKDNNKENLEPNINKTDNKIKIKIKHKINCDLNNIINDTSNNSVEKHINSKFEDINVSKIDKNNTLTNEEMNRYSFPMSTFVTKQRVYKSKNILPDITREQKTKDSTLDDYFKLNEKINNNDTNNIFLNDNTNYNSNYNEGTTNFLDMTNANHFNTFNSENNSLKNNTRGSYNYSSLFKKALKKKYVIKEFSNSVQYGQNNNRYNKYNSNTDVRSNSNNNTIQDKLISYKSNEEVQPQQLSNELITRLRDWLISCDLLCYYNVLIKNNIFDIDSYINNLKNNKINISYKDIEDLGLKKPGHIFRFLLKLQMDIGTLDNKVCNYILNKFNENMVSTIGLNISVNEFKCCGMVLCPGNNDKLKSSNYSDIFGFLRNKDLMEFKENFIHNGFDQIEFVLIQLFSCFSFNKDIMNDYFHIYSDNDKIKVIKKLYEEKRIISRELGLEYDEREVYNIINEQIEDSSNSEVRKRGEKKCHIF